jgi:hypothetical protein
MAIDQEQQIPKKHEPTIYPPLVITASNKSIMLMPSKNHSASNVKNKK